MVTARMASGKWHYVTETELLAEPDFHTSESGSMRLLILARGCRGSKKLEPLGVEGSLQHEPALALRQAH